MEIKKKKPNGYWTFDICRKEALKYISRTEFYKNNNKAYHAAREYKWLNEICTHMIPQGNLMKRYVYKAMFPNNSVYIGLTYNFEQRKSEHLSKNKSTVYKYMIQTNTEPIFELLSDLLSKEDASALEIRLIDEYKNNGVNILNKIKGGALGGGNLIWTLEKYKEEALKYSNRKNFKENSLSAYSAACRDKNIDEICLHMIQDRKYRGYWTYELVKEEALKYTDMTEFKKKSSTAYGKAYDNNWLDTICMHYIKRPSRGEKHHGTILTEKQVLEIRSSNLSQRKLSKIYNTSQTNISSIIRKETWTHI